MLTPVPRELVTTGGDGVRVGSVVVSADDRCATAAAVLGGLPTVSGGVPVTVSVAVSPGGPAEGYRLVVSGSDVTITGSDPAGAFYGAQTLLGLAADGVLPPVTVADWPELRRRGTIEGFYGPPWSHADRLAHLEFAGRHKLNTYVYAPKDDPYHRARWREPYPAIELERLGELAAAAKRSHVRFVFSVSPGLSMVYSDPAELDLLVAKLAQVRDVGVEDVALLFDDIPPDLSHSADRSVFGTAPGSSARAHAAVCRAVIDRLGLDRPLIMVPTDYAGTSATPHRDFLAAELPAEVLVWWTGRDIVVGDITRADIEAAARSYGHELLLWDNFPVNDFDFPRLFLGPLLGRTTSLAGAPLAGITANPMPHEAASRIALATVAEWAWNPAAYEADAAHERALSAVGASAAVRTLARACASWPPSAPQDPQLSELTEAALGGSAAAVEELRDRFTAMAAAAPGGAREPADRMEGEVMPWLVALADTGRAGLAALAALAPSAGERERSAAVEALAVAEAHEQQNVLRTVVPPFVQAVLAR